MSLNISLFVHGVPHGQKTFGATGDDQAFLGSFYGPKWDAPEILKVDVMSFGNAAYTYYSFIKGINVCDVNGREGAYFGLTLKMNAVYVDIQNIYSILRAAYYKMCVGLCVSDNGSAINFKVSEFTPIENELKQIEKHVINYISEFSTADDILPFNKLRINVGGQPPLLNLHECARANGLKTLQQFGKVVVSPYYPSAQTAQIIAQSKNELQTMRQQFQQELQNKDKACHDQIVTIQTQSQSAISECKSKAAKDAQEYETKLKSQSVEWQEKIDVIQSQNKKDLAECKAKAEREVQDIKQQKEKDIKALKDKYSDVDHKIDEYKQQIKNFQRNEERLNSSIAQKEKEISKLDSKIQQLQQTVNDVAIKLDGQQQNGTVVENSGSRDSALDHDGKQQCGIAADNLGNKLTATETSKTEKAIEFIKRYGVIFLLFFSIVALGCVIYSMWHSMQSQEDTESTVVIGAEGNLTNNEGNLSPASDGIVGFENEPSIQIEGHELGDSIRMGEIWKVKLINSNIEDVVWVSEDLDINADAISLKKNNTVSECCLRCETKDGTSVITSIIIPVKK